MRRYDASVPRFRCCEADLLQRVLLQPASVDVELTDAFGKFLGCHGIFVVHPTEGLLIQVETTAGGCLRRF